MDMDTSSPASKDRARALVTGSFVCQQNLMHLMHQHLETCTVIKTLKLLLDILLDKNNNALSVNSS